MAFTQRTNQKPTVFEEDIASKNLALKGGRITLANTWNNSWPLTYEKKNLQKPTSNMAKVILDRSIPETSPRGEWKKLTREHHPESWLGSLTQESSFYKVWPAGFSITTD